MVDNVGDSEVDDHAGNARTDTSTRTGATTRMSLDVLDRDDSQAHRIPCSGPRGDSPVALSRRRVWDLEHAAITMVGEAEGWFDAEADGNGVIVRPSRPLPRRCLIRPAALFQHGGGYFDVNTVMGRMLFSPATTLPQRYTPFTYDPHRELRRLFLPIEATPDDDLHASVGRWSRNASIATELLLASGVGWGGLPGGDIEDLIRLEPWLQPLEGCVLHALTQWTHECGECVIEIGSLRGQSASMLALALRGVGSRSLLLSIDPHQEQHHNREQVRLTLAQVGEERRLVQIPCASDQACRIVKPATASLVFVDGDHSYRQVVADFEHYREIVAPGGCIVFHDYGYGDHNGQADVVPGVRSAIEDHVMSADGFQPLLLAHTLFAFRKNRS